MNYLIIDADKLQERINLEISSLESAAEELIQERDNEEEADLRLEKAEAYKDILKLITSESNQVAIPTEEEVKVMAEEYVIKVENVYPSSNTHFRYKKLFTAGANSIINLLK